MTINETAREFSHGETQHYLDVLHGERTESAFGGH